MKAEEEAAPNLIRMDVAKQNKRRLEHCMVELLSGKGYERMSHNERFGILTETLHVFLLRLMSFGEDINQRIASAKFGRECPSSMHSS
jgi:hypothetical protein